MKKKKDKIYIVNVIDGIEYVYMKDDKTEEYHLISRTILQKKER